MDKWLVLQLTVRRRDVMSLLHVVFILYILSREQNCYYYYYYYNFWNGLARAFRDLYASSCDSSAV